MKNTQILQLEKSFLSMGVNVSLSPNQISSFYNKSLHFINKKKQEYKDERYRKSPELLDFLKKLGMLQ